MRKLLPCLLVGLMLLICAPAVAETYVFDDLLASMEVPDSYIVLTEENLGDYAAWLESRGTSVENTQSDFKKRGVLLQAWSAEYDACFELRAVQNERSANIFDVNEQSTEVRGDYRTSHYPDNEYEGYDFSTSEWKNTANGRFLVLRYIRRDNGEILYRGFMRRTIRNGYEIDFDMQIYGRATTNKDNNNLNKIWETFNFIEIKPLPPAASAKINISDAPPTESNEQSFDIKGTAAEGVKLTAVVMGLSYPEPVVTDVTVGKNGKFTLPIKLPREGVFLITITGEYQGEDVVELAYPVTYQRTLLTVNFINEPAATVTEDDVKISGTGEPGASIQVFLNGESVMTKRVTTAGKFSLTLEAKEEGPYEAILVFSKKGLADRRFTFSFNRKWTDADMMDYLSKQAVKPSYSQLIKKMEGYEGRIMGYKAYITDIGQSGDEYIVRMALARQNKQYTNFILVTTDEKPAFEVGERVMMYGTCAGMSLSTGVEGEDENEASYPCFELLLFASLE
ncbi:MAG: Ig-like domain-containing protein [Clostridiales bacterium]|nr:Ig-like domain-containing protein [Clostridiales bacterium]